MADRDEPRSERRTFPQVVVESKAMVSLRDQLATCLKPVIPLCAVGNELEVPALVKLLRQRKEISRQAVFVDNDVPRSFTRGEDEIGAIVFRKGDEIPESVQNDVIQRRYHKLRLVIALVRGVELTWHRTFLQQATRIIHWPLWNERRQDHRKLLELMHAGLSMPGGAPVPVLGEDAFQMLSARSLPGTDAVHGELKAALSRYITAGDTSGRLTREHFNRNHPDGPRSSRRSMDAAPSSRRSS